MLTTQRNNALKLMSVLIADDDRTMRTMLREILRTCGLQVVGEANDGKEALELYRKLQPHIVCLDMHMPAMNGMEVLTAIRSESPNVIIVLITGSPTMDVVKGAIAARVDGIIAKPFSAKRIADEIERCLARATEKKAGT